MNDPDVGGNALHQVLVVYEDCIAGVDGTALTAFVKTMLPGENIHGNADIAQGAGQIAYINIHPPGFALAGSGQRAGVEGYEGYSCFAQLLLTAIGLLTTIR